MYIASSNANWSERQQLKWILPGLIMKTPQLIQMLCTFAVIYCLGNCQIYRRVRSKLWHAYTHVMSPVCFHLGRQHVWLPNSVYFFNPAEYLLNIISWKFPLPTYQIVNVLICCYQQVSVTALWISSVLSSCVAAVPCSSSRGRITTKAKLNNTGFLSIPKLSILIAWLTFGLQQHWQQHDNPEKSIRRKNVT